MTIVKLPSQKKARSAKGTKWGKENMDVIDHASSYFNNEQVRRTMKEKYILSDLYDGKLHMEDVAATISSAGVLNAYVPKIIQHRPIIRPKIELLLGEAAKEPFSWSVMVTDPASIASKKEKKKEIINQKITELLERDLEPEALKSKMKELELYFKYTWKDAKEVRASKILKYFEQKLKMQEKFNESMLDKLNYGEEIIMFDIVGKSMEAFKLDPKKVHTLHSGDSNRIADADIIVIEEYWPVGRIIDNLYDVLTPKEIDRLNEGDVNRDSDNRYQNAASVSTDGIILDTVLDSANRGSNPFTANRALIDSNGNYRVLRAMWRSQKLVKVVKGFDPETGEPYEKTMSEEYVADPTRGESIEKVWVGEWWQGTKIGSDIYKKIQPRPVQFNTAGNISKGHPGIVGYCNSTSGGRVVSFLTKMKPFQYLYDIGWERLLDALKKDLGNIVEMDMAKKPAGWDTKKWLSYAYKGGIMFVDSFKEGQKGSAHGKMAGHFNTTGKTLSTSNGNYIQQHINLLEYIKKEMGDIVGITPQREGAVGTSATMGGTERAVMQSNNNTAYEFYMHEQFKLECYQVMLETGKVALAGNTELLQIVLDDFSIEMFDVEGDDFIDSDYSVFITTSKKSKEIEADIKMFSQAFMQNGGNLSVVLDVLFSDSSAEKRRKIELAEHNMKADAQAASKAEQEAAAKIAQQEAADKEAERELKRYEIDSNNATKLQIAGQNAATEEVKMSHQSVDNANRDQVEREKIQASKQKQTAG